MTCARCQSDNTMKYGRTHDGKQRYRCRDCGRQFVDNPTRQPVEASPRELVDKLLLERLSLAGIARVTGVAPRWLQTYVNQKLESETGGCPRRFIGVP